MKRTFRIAVIGLSAALGTICLCSCGNGKSGKSTELGVPKAPEALSYQELTGEALKNMRESIENFSATFAAAAYEGYTGAENFTVSPISVYMALALSAECAAGNTRQELLSALGLSYETLSTDFSSLYRSLAIERKTRTDFGEEVVTARLSLGNSIWVDNRTSVKNAAIQSLADKYYCYSYSADFFGDNANANLAVKEFVKQQTNGLIDKNFQLDTSTAFALINTLYLKDVWSLGGQELRLTAEQYAFKEKGGEAMSVNLLEGLYEEGRAYETERYKHFFAQTDSGYKIKFLLPKDGYSVEDVFTAENIAEVNSLDTYHAIDEENKIKYHTRCLFPEYKAAYDDDIIPILESNFGIHDLFNEYDCDFHSLTDTTGIYCKKIQHVAKLAVDRKGIEGAAVTVMMDVGSSAPTYENVYETLVIDRAFGFILTDRYDTVLFSGVVDRL